MKSDTPGQAARLNAEFDKLTEWQKKAVLILVAQARLANGRIAKILQDSDEAYAYKRSGDGKIAWGINSGYKPNFCVARGVFE